MKIRSIIGASCALLTLCVAAHAQTPARPAPQVQILIGTSAGGGYDLYARLAARHLGRFLPGTPSVIANNMPGAGQVIMANWLYNVGPRDGTAIGQIPTTTAFEAAMGNNQAQYDATKFNWIGSLDGYETIAIVWADSPIVTAKDFLTKKVIIGGSAAASDVNIWPKLINSIFGAKLELVAGYVGTAQIALAMDRGEVQGMVGGDWHGVELSRPDWVKNKKIRVPVQFLAERAPDLPDVPTATEIVDTPKTREFLPLFYKRQKFGRPYAAAPGTPPEKVAQLREAFWAMAHDEQFLADAAKIGAIIEPARGEDVEALVREFYATPKDVIARASEELRRASQ